MPNDSRDKRLLTTAFVVLGGFFIAFLLSLYSIGEEVGKHCQVLQQDLQTQTKGDCVDKHLAYLESADLSPNTWSSYVWSLGQLSDRRSVPFLEKAITHNPCVSQEGKETKCSYEAKKALKWSSTYRNLLSPIWRLLFL